jgi:hypothetical protein
MLTPYQALSHKGLNLPLSFALFPPLLLDPLTTLPQVIPDPQTVQHHIDYDRSQRNQGYFSNLKLMHLQNDSNNSVSLSLAAPKKSTDNYMARRLLVTSRTEMSISTRKLIYLGSRHLYFFSLVDSAQGIILSIDATIQIVIGSLIALITLMSSSVL